MTAGSMLIGALSAPLGARWSLALMGSAGAFSMITLYITLPRARLIR